MHPNEQVLRKAIDAFVAGDIPALTELLADDLVFHCSGQHQLSGDYKGRQAFLDDFLGKVFELTGGTMTLEPHDILGSDDHAVGIYTMRAQRDGKSYEWSHVNVYHVRDGKIFEIWFTPFNQQTVNELFA